MASVIDLVTADHRRVEALFERFRTDYDGAVASAIFRELAAHAEAEEHLLYPAMLALDENGAADAPDGASAEGSGGGDVDESYREHSALKALITRARQSEGAALVQLMEDVQEEVAAHVQREETTMLPRLAAELDAYRLNELGARLEQIKQRVG